MTDNVNIRDFRNAGQTDEAENAEKSNRGFYTCVIAIPVIAALAGVGYKPLMDLRNGSLATVQQAELDMEARRRAENPMYALMNGPKNADGLIDLNAPMNFGGNSGPSPETKARREIMKRGLSPQEFLSRVDAKAYDFSPLDMETLKYTRTQSALSNCGYADLRKYYTKSNEATYLVLKASADGVKDEERKAQHAQIGQLELPKIENKTQALAFVASGGVARHQEAAMNTFAGIASMTDGMDKQSVKFRRQRFNKTQCMQVRTIIQSGAMNVKANTRLR